jgi:hypothetical protein
MNLSCAILAVSASLAILSVGAQGFSLQKMVSK